MDVARRLGSGLRNSSAVRVFWKSPMESSVAKYQGENGRIPHEVPQTVSLVPWFKLYPYGLASADATPLYIIGTADYVRASGDLAFAGAKWDSLWRAYQWLRSTYEANGFAKNQGIGHGWIEGGPLLPVSSELYQVGVAIQAQQSLADLAGLLQQTGSAVAFAGPARAQEPNGNRVLVSGQEHLRLRAQSQGQAHRSRQRAGNGSYVVRIA